MDLDEEEYKVTKKMKYKRTDCKFNGEYGCTALSVMNCENCKFYKKLEE